MNWSVFSWMYHKQFGQSVEDDFGRTKKDTKSELASHWYGLKVIRRIILHSFQKWNWHWFYTWILQLPTLQFRLWIRHRENLQRAENSSTIYHSHQIEQNGKISCLCSDSQKITKKVSCFHKMKKNATENYDVHRNTTRKMSSKIFKIFHNSIIFVLKSINWIIFRGNFQEAEKSEFNFGPQQNFYLRAANFRSVCYEYIVSETIVQHFQFCYIKNSKWC